MANFVDDIKATADTGDAAAQYELGMLYAFGEKGVEKNWGKAKELFHKAADGHVSNAMAYMVFINSINSR